MEDFKEKQLLQSLVVAVAVAIQAALTEIPSQYKSSSLFFLSSSLLKDQQQLVGGLYLQKKKKGKKTHQIMRENGVKMNFLLLIISISS